MNENIDELMAKKVATAMKTVENRLKVVRLLERLANESDMTSGERRVWITSIYNPAKRKHAAALQTVEFWKDRDQIDSWITKQKARDTEIQAFLTEDEPETNLKETT